MKDKKLSKFLNDKVGEWHDSDSALPLHNYLRLEWHEYVDWIYDGTLPNDMKSRWGIG